MNIVDSIVIIYLIIACITGIRKGFIKTFFDTLGVIIAFFVSKKYYTLAKDYLINNTKVYATINDYLSQKFSKLAAELPNNNFNPSNLFKGFDKLPNEVQNFSSSVFNIESVPSSSNSLNQYVDKVSEIIVIIISFVLVMLIAYIILLLITSIIDKVFKVPGLNVINSMFGGVFGILRGVIIMYVIFAVASPFIAFSEGNMVVNEVLNSRASIIFYENNVILSYLLYKGIL